MTAVTNTFLSTAAKGNREELSDVVNRVTPEDTPIYSLIPKETTKSTHPQWEIDDLAVPAPNAQSEGDKFEFTALTTPTRVRNYTQIFRKDWIISQTQEAVDNAGSVEQSKYQKLKKGIELRKDIEFALVSTTASLATDPRKLGSLNTWCVTNYSGGTTGAANAYNATNNVTKVPTAGTARDLDKSILDAAMQKVYNSGGTPKFAICSPKIKTVFTSFMSNDNVASFRYSATPNGKNSIIATADIYEGDFGKITIIPNRVQTTGTTAKKFVHLIDPDLLSMKMLRKIHSVKNLSQRSDAVQGVLIGEGTLCVKNEKGLGCIADLKG